jgi:hypothetical protein
MKNEGPFIVEWVAYHLSIGFDGFLVYSNDCTDKTDAILDRLESLGLCKHLRNPRVGNQMPQAVAIRDMFRQEFVTSAEWVLFSDCDEFLNIKTGDGTLDSLFQKTGDAEVLSPMWRLFGDSGIASFKDCPVTVQFTRAAPKHRSVSNRAWGFKSLFKPTKNIIRIGPHRPYFENQNAMRGKWLNSNGLPMDEQYLSEGWRYKRNAGAGYALMQLNHYAVRSIESFLVKCDRGHVLHTHKDIDLAYYEGMNFNDEEDKSILKFRGRFEDYFDVLLEDRMIRELHFEAVALHKAKALELRRQRPELFSSLRSASQNSLPNVSV